MCEEAVDEEAVDEATVDTRAMGVPDAGLSPASSLLPHLINNLLNPVLEIRILSVRLLQQSTRQDEVHNVLSVIVQVLEAPLGLQTVRQIAMLIRRLVVLQKVLKSDQLLRKIVPYFYLGLLSANSAPITQEINSAISDLCKDPINEEVLCDIIVKCLQRRDDVSAFDELSVNKDPPSSQQQWPRLQALRDESQDSSAVSDEFRQNLDRLLLAEEPNSAGERLPINRLQALQVFKSIPNAAEKRSRFVVPEFLSMRSAQEYVRQPLASSAPRSSQAGNSGTAPLRSSFLERKTFLELLVMFNNPKALFKSQDVYHTLLEFLTVGQTEIQKLALRALFTWKLQSVRRYEESLLKLTEETTYRDELTSLFHADTESSTILDEDRKELFPILLRVLFGQMTNRSGSNRNHSGQEAKRKTTLRMLSSMQDDEITQFLDLAFGDISIHKGPHGTLENDEVSVDVISAERQYGLVRSAKSLLETLKGQLAPFGERILGPVLYCLYRACRGSDDARADDGDPRVENQSSLSRAIRRTAIQCLCMIFQNCDSVNWPVHLPSIFKYVVRPRLGNFAIENSQGVSVLLQLFAAWASNSKSVSYLHDYDESLLDRVADCLSTQICRDEVKIYVLDQIFSKLAALSTQQSDFTAGCLAVFQSHMRSLLKSICIVLEGKSDGKVLDSAVNLLVNLAPLATSSTEVEPLIAAITTLIGEPPKRIGPKIKGNLLQALIHLLTFAAPEVKRSSTSQLRQTISTLFNYFLDIPNRRRLAEILELLCLDDEKAREIASLCFGLNAVSSGKLDEIDYDARLDTFKIINSKSVGFFSPELWALILQNLIYFARAATDFAIRSNATSSLRQFIIKAGELGGSGYDVLLQSIILEALRKSAKADSESVRADHVAMFGLLVQKCPGSEGLSDMQGLLAGNDEEASFFSNILHVQYHRRARAMYRLSNEAGLGVLRSTNICNFLLPLLEKFIFDPRDDDSIRNLRGQAIVAVGTLLPWIEWPQFRAVFKRYKGYMSTKTGTEKDVIKLLGVSADALVSCSSVKRPTSDPDKEDAQPAKVGKLLEKSFPNIERLSEELAAHFIPDLASFIHQKDESQVTSRIPVAITTVKLLSILPEAQRALFLPPLLLDVAYILRSRSQDARDIGRRTLAEVAAILGPQYMHWILKELRTALSRGYQLHVLSYTVHSILVSTTDYLKPGDLDHSLEDFVAIVMDDIFGTVGQEKDAEDYISSMREVKNSKSFDSMELLAKATTVRHVIELIRPLLTVLTGTITSKQSRQTDELLRRIGLGLSRNSLAGSRDMLTFAYQVIQELYKERQPANERQMTNDDRNRQRFLIQLSGANKTVSARSSSSMFKLAKFALDLLRSTLQKHDTLLKPETVHGFLPILGDALIQAREEVKISAMRTLAVIIKLPMGELDENANLYILEAVKVVKDSVNTNDEAAQAALKLIAAVLRERKSVRIRDSDLSYLLQRIIPDLEEPDRQGVTFNFIRAVMSRKFMLPEVYDASKRIGMIMVTNQGQGARDVARGVFVQFILDYPQSRERWNKQIKFLIKNLGYQYPEGRQSIMGAIHILLNKVSQTVAQELISKLFIPLLLIMANDDNSDCREIAGALIGRCFAKADQEHLRSVINVLQSWIQQAENAALIKTGLQTFKILFEVPEVMAENEVAPLLLAMERIAQEAIQDKSDASFEPLHHALQLLPQMTTSFPGLTLSEHQSRLWRHIQALLLFPHPWIQIGAAGLVGTWFQDVAIANKKLSLGSLPLVSSQGLELTGDAQLQVLTSSLRILKSKSLSKELSSQTVRNLVFLGRCFGANRLEIDKAMRTKPRQADEQDDKRGDLRSDTEDEDGDESAGGGKCLAITYLLGQLSSILRHEPRTTPTTASLLPKHCALKLLTGLIHNQHQHQHHSSNNNHNPPKMLSPNLLSHTILPPLAHLTDPSLPPPHQTQHQNQPSSSSSSSDPTLTSSHRDLVTSASELLDLIQKTVGPDVYIQAMTLTQRRRREKREQRRTKRKLEAVRDPQAAAREKSRKVEKEKRRKKVVREGWRRGRMGV